MSDLISGSTSAIKGYCSMLPAIEIDEHFFLEPVNQKDHEWQVCKHFGNPEDLNGIVKQYKNFNALIVFCGTILCDQCYKSLIEGKHQNVFEFCFEITNTQYKQIMGNALVDANKEMQSDLIFSA
jgi:hypothetical protein